MSPTHDGVPDRAGIQPVPFDFSPSKATSGLFDNIVAKISDIQITTNPPPNYGNDMGGKMPLFCQVTFETDHGESEQQFYSMGGTSADYFMPDASGYSLVLNPGIDRAQAKLAKKTAFMNLMESMVALNVPESLFSPSLKNLIGMAGLWSRKVFIIEGLPERQQKPAMPGETKRTPVGTLVLARLDSLPGNKTSAGPAKRGAASVAKPVTPATAPTAELAGPGSAPAPAPSTNAAAIPGAALNMDGVSTTDAESFIGTLLDANGGSVNVAAATRLLFTAFKSVGPRNEVKALLADEAKLYSMFGAVVTNGVLTVDTQ